MRITVRNHGWICPNELIADAMDEIAFIMEVEALRQIDEALVEAEIADIGAPQNQLEAVK